MIFLKVFWMNNNYIEFPLLNWKNIFLNEYFGFFFNWIISRPDSMKKWILKKDRPPLISRDAREKKDFSILVSKFLFFFWNSTLPFNLVPAALINVPIFHKLHFLNFDASNLSELWLSTLQNYFLSDSNNRSLQKLRVFYISTTNFSWG